MKTRATIEREGLSIAEACAAAGIGRTKLYEAIRDARLKTRRLGRRRLVLRRDLQEFLERLPSE
jgi:excisionase family DNA binding protein